MIPEATLLATIDRHETRAIEYDAIGDEDGAQNQRDRAECSYAELQIVRQTKLTHAMLKARSVRGGVE